MIYIEKSSRKSLIHFMGSLSLIKLIRDNFIPSSYSEEWYWQ